MSLVVGQINIREESAQVVLLFDNWITSSVISFYQNAAPENQDTIFHIPASLETPYRIQVTIPIVQENYKITTEEGVQLRGRLHLTKLDSLIIVSCDLPEADTRESLWNKIGQAVHDRATLVLHIGDNIYADNCYHAHNDFKDAYHAYQARYRQTWFSNYKGLANPRNIVWQNASNLMIGDDHEIANNVQYTEADFKARAALEAYHNYQSSLHLELEHTINLGWYKIVDDYLAIISFERMMASPSVQEIIGYLSGLVLPDTVTNLVITCGWPIIPAPPHTHGLGKFMDIQDLILLYSYLFTRDEQIILVGGDLHFSLLANLRAIGNKKVIQLVSASPITNNPTLERKKWARSYPTSMQLSNELFIDIVSAKARRSYLDIQLPNMIPSLIYNNQKRPRNLLDYYYALYRMRA